jgi:hypothetical protein
VDGELNRQRREIVRSTLRNIREVQAALAHENSLFVLICTFLATVVFPVIEGFLAAARPDIAQDIPLWIAIFFIHLMFSIVSLRGIYSLRKIIDLTEVNRIEELVALADELEHQDKRVRTLISQGTVTKVSLAFLRHFLRSPSNRDFKKDMDDLMGMLVEIRAEVLGFSSAESVWSFTLYIYDQSTDKLIVRWRKHDERLKPENRSWQPGFGHAGISFVQDEVMITADASALQGVMPNVISTESQRDLTFYRSFISIPVSSPDIVPGTKQVMRPLGVLAITSSTAGQFNDDYYPIARVYGLILSTYLSQYPFALEN